MTVIVLINWNGADDTIECLRSLDRAQGDFMVVVADNGSLDDSLDRIGRVIPELSFKTDLLPLGRNWGFAVGNNRAIDYARVYNPDSYLLLNNDTVVEPDFLKKLQEYHSTHRFVKILGPLICYCSERRKIWSCGGELTFGSRRALLRNCSVDTLDATNPVKVSFISGCALFVDASLVGDDGHLLTERFFFGEEDFEFAHRMRRRGEKMAVIPDSVIYHKVSSSAKRMSSRATLGRDYIYYLGRLIVIREYYNPFSAAIIRLLSRRRCKKYFVRDGLDRRRAGRLVSRLMHESRYKEGIGYDDFRSIVIDGTFFDTI